MTATVWELHDLDLIDAGIAKRLGHLPCPVVICPLPLGDKNEIRADHGDIGAFKRRSAEHRVQDRNADPSQRRGSLPLLTGARC
jgi:hypothetical protein